MVIKFYKNASPNNKISKSITEVSTQAGVLRDDCDVIRPVVRFEMVSLPDANYCYIAEFGRYYFITDVKAVRRNIFDIAMRVDVLMSFKTLTKSCTGILTDSESVGVNNYLPHDNYVSLVKDKTDIISFSGGLLNNGEYILITAGG